MLRMCTLSIYLYVHNSQPLFVTHYNALLAQSTLNKPTIRKSYVSDRMFTFEITKRTVVKFCIIGVYKHFSLKFKMKDRNFVI